VEGANSVVNEDLAEVRRDEELVAVDNYGRTRAASRRYAAIASKTTIFRGARSRRGGAQTEKEDAAGT
jgi:hypothetical protein